MKTPERIHEEQERAGVEWHKYAALLAPYTAGEKAKDLEFELIHARYHQITGAMLALYWMNGQRDSAC